MEKRGSAWKFGQVCDLPTFPHLAPPSPQALPSGPDALCLPHRYISIPASPGRSLRWQSYRQALDHWPMNEQVQRRHSNQGFCLAQCPVEPGVPITFFEWSNHTLVLHVVWPLRITPVHQVEHRSLVAVLRHHGFSTAVTVTGTYHQRAATTNSQTQEGRRDANRRPRWATR